GGVSSIPAAVAVWALVKPRVFAAYLSLGITGAIAAGLTWGAIAA
ncbi:MAG: permease, partial [Pseudomonadota bacterium]